MSILLSLDSGTGKGEDFTTAFAQPLNLTQDHEVSLLSLSYIYSIRNIDSSYGNNTFRYSPDNGVTWKTVTVPNGIYDLPDIDAYFKSVMKANGDYTAGATPDDDVYYLSFSANTNILRVILNVANNYRFDFTTSDFILLFGGTKAFVTATTTCANSADFNRGVTSLLLNCDLVSGSYVNGIIAQHLASFQPDVLPGSYATFTPTLKYYLPLKTRNIQRIRIYITDQLGRAVSFFGETVTVALHMRPVGTRDA